jgi:putative two-component system response regulator
VNELEKTPVVLAVDDTPENLDVVKGLLTPRFTVKAAVNGMMALKIVEKKPPANTVSADIPVIFLTGESDAESEADALAAGAVGYITKPINPDTLLAKIDDCLN